MSARNGDLAAIHIRKGELGLTDDEYRDLLFSIQRVRSARDLDFAGRRSVLEHFNRLAKAKGVDFKRPGRTGIARASTADRKTILAKINAQLLELGLSREYLEQGGRGGVSMCRRLAGVDKLEFATPAGLEKLMIALAVHQRRRDVEEA